MTRRGDRWLVLCVHEVVRAGPVASPWALDESRLDAVLDRVLSEGWLPARVDAPDEDGPPRRVAVTIDDCRAGALNWLANRPHSATLFPVARFIDEPEGLPARERYSNFATWSQLADAVAAGHGIGCHTLSHRPLSGLDDGDIEHELVDGRASVEARLGPIAPVLALPYGRFDDRVLHAALTAGYTTILTTRPCVNTVQQWRTGLLDRVVLRSDRNDLGLPEELLL